MEMRLERVTQENRAAVLALRVRPGQEGYVESVEECLAEASGLACWRPVAVMEGETCVGFAMYGFFDAYPPAGRVWMDRLLIGDAYQGCGRGKAAMALLLRRLEAEYGAQAVYLSVVPGNAAAQRLYEGLGFHMTEELDVHGEHVMVRPAARPENGERSGDS